MLHRVKGESRTESDRKGTISICKKGAQGRESKDTWWLEEGKRGQGKIERKPMAILRLLIVLSSTPEAEAE